MGSQTTQTTQQAVATPEEKALNQQQINMNNFMQPYAQQNYADLSNNIDAILKGNQPQAKGIGGIDDAQNQSMVNASVRSVLPQFQSAGILDSGIAAQGAIRAAQDTSNQNAQFNVSAAQNLFNLASGGQSNLQGQLQSNTNNLSNSLAGLRQTNSSSTIFANPFQTAAQLMQGAGSLASGISGTGGAKSLFCWVASEIFGGWYHHKTVMARIYIDRIAPEWFKEFYIHHGEKIAKFISDKPILKLMLQPLFEIFVLIAEKEVCYG
jgi:hypothetical protein